MPVRSRLGRIAGLLFAAWFAVFQTEPAAVHACAMHDGGSGHGAHGTTSVQGSDSHASHLRAESVGAAHEGSAPSQDAPATTCTCPGGCAAASAAAIPGSTEATIADAVISDAATLRGQPETLRLVNAEHVLPFANGPPTV